jgi:hypothetical protein
MRITPFATTISALLLLGLILTGYGNLQLRRELRDVRAQKQELTRQLDAQAQAATPATRQEQADEPQAASPQAIAGLAPHDPATTQPANASAGVPASPPQPVGPPLTPAEILQINDDQARAGKLRDMVRDLVTEAVGLDEELRRNLLRRLDRYSPERGGVGLTPFLASIIGQLPNNAGLVAQWKESFRADPDRALIFSRLAGTNPSPNPAEWDRVTEGWTPWERDLYRNNMLRALAEGSPAEALRLARNNPRLFSQAALTRMFREYSDSTPEDFARVFDGLNDPQLRGVAIEARARSLASENTLAALDWADNLPTQPERDRAHEVIYDVTPRGIGALMRQEGGFPTIVEPMDGGPAMGVLEPGDRVVRITEGDGTPTDLYSRPFPEVIESIRGEPGTPVTLKILRWDESTGRMGELDVTLNRQQLYFNREDGQG